MSFKTYFLISLMCLFLVLSFRSPMSLMFVLWIVVYLLRERLRKIASKFPASLGYIAIGTFLGLLIEIFAILDNFSKPAQEKILIHPNPFLDLFFGFFSYGLVMIVWYLLLRKRVFSEKSIFFISGFYGILTEQFNGTPVILLNMFTNPLAGIPYAILVIFVYGLWPMLAYLITKEGFEKREKASFWFKLLALIALWIQWAVFGNFILPFLKTFFG